MRGTPAGSAPLSTYSDGALSVKKTIGVIGQVIREIRRWRNRHRRPDLAAEVTQTPYWGGVELPILVRNTGSAAARDCRYCRRQHFRMDRGQSQAPAQAVTWYATDAFDLPMDGSERRLTAYATSDSCPSLALTGIHERTPDGRFEAVLVCRDRFGTCYRFGFVDGGDPVVDSWRASPFDRLRRRAPPEWTGWLQLSARVENRQWTTRLA